MLLTRHAHLPGARQDRVLEIRLIARPRRHGDQDVILGDTAQTLTIRHETTSRESFVPGVLLAVRAVRSLPPGLTVGLDTVIRAG